MDAKFLEKHEKDSELIVSEALKALESDKQARIAELLGLNSGTVHNWVAGKSTLSPNRARKILLAFYKTTQ